VGTIRFRGSDYLCNNGETVLQTLTRNGARIPSSCNAGVCQACLMQAANNTPPQKSQVGLSDAMRVQGCFMSCICALGTDETLEVDLPGLAVRPTAPAMLVTRKALNSDIYQLIFEAELPQPIRPGQFINLQRDSDNLTRSYSVAGICFDTIELHVRRLQGGQMSSWLTEEMQPGTMCTFQGPNGTCCYKPGTPEQTLILAGTGSGLAPLYGIVNDALANGHSGPIHLYHGSYAPEGLYLVDELQSLAHEHSNFRYNPCADVVQPGSNANLRASRVDIALSVDFPRPTDCRVYLCGHPAMVKSCQKKLFLAGVPLAEIFADPFVSSTPIHTPPAPL
jgi:NAD(P)H-flavin reductase/ferredoxin